MSCVFNKEIPRGHAAETLLLPAPRPLFVCVSISCVCFVCVVFQSKKDSLVPLWERKPFICVTRVGLVAFFSFEPRGAAMVLNYQSIRNECWVWRAQCTVHSFSSRRFSVLFFYFATHNTWMGRVRPVSREKKPEGGAPTRTTGRSRSHIDRFRSPNNTGKTLSRPFDDRIDLRSHVWCGVVQPR